VITTIISNQTWYGNLLLLVKSEDSLKLYQRIVRLVAVRGHNTGFVAGLIGMVSLEFGVF
jgi:hypothetical protein